MKVIRRNVLIKIGLLIMICFSMNACNRKENADTLFFNGKIYTVDSVNTVVECVVVKAGKIAFAGNLKEAEEKFTFSKKEDLKGKFMYPGFIDAHCHFYGYAMDMDKANLFGTKSWKETLEKLKSFVDGKINTEDEIKEGQWVLGRGWDQNDWDKKEFPTKAELDKMFPVNPVFLVRIDGHAAIVNQMALDLAAIDETSFIAGGEIKLENKKLTGLLIDNAMELVRVKILELNREKKIKFLQAAQQKCFEVGLTTVSDAGLTKENIFLIDTLQKQDTLQIRMYAMVADSTASKDYFFSHGPYKTDHMHVRAIKYYADGALGSRGACLLDPYSDDKNNSGFLLGTQEYFQKQAKLCDEKGFQMNTHCIGDSASRFILNLYGNILKGKNNKRWRIEHCQIVNEDDFHLFGNYSIVPSIQPCFATSDMYWAEKRIGEKRMSGAYAWQKLLKAFGLVANGSDFPVESINPLFGFYAAVSRQDQHAFPEGGFQMQDALSRLEALKGMTIWAAFADFEEKERGSIEAGKFADFTILEKDIMSIPASELFNVRVWQTWVGGKKVFERT